MQNPTTSPLLYAETHSNADMLYFGRVEVHDPFIALGVRGKKISVQSALEFGRVKKTSAFDIVLSREVYLERAQDLYGPQAGVAEIIATLAGEYRLRYFRVADDFPAGLYVKLTALGLKLTFANGMLFPEREIKSAWEAACIREGNRLCTVGYAVAEKILRAAKIKGRTLLYQGKLLTSERLRFALETAIHEQGGNPQDTIVAGGDQACDPHERGFGPLRPKELIIIDVFPRVVKTGYFGDMTRTYLKGRASEAQQKLVSTVRTAQQRATKVICANVDGRLVHQAVTQCFAAAGYETKRKKNGSEGFFHGTGHGLGLAIHDPGRMAATTAYLLKKGSVMTVEPGLYYPGLGGCRWEDVVQVTATGTKALSKHPYNWEIR
ncbi:MAG: aminopeptidase P family protein [Opitutaceae bacterium]|jgi:Xaa-Pro aminopeptidase|nr:aminopeptidase P family protein [Opitutaceae bacterium]NBR58201.1 aminopeptidase P family protein [Opitutaceae bacterium]